MSQPIRILQVVGKMHYGGMETLIMNIYRNIDREKVQFDFLVHYDEPGEYDEEILCLGGRIYHMPKTKIKNYFKYKKALNCFFDKHKEYKVVHGHLQSTAFIYHSIAKKNGVKCCITHSHNTGVDKNFKGRLAFFTSKLAERYTDEFFACSNDAAKFFFPRTSKNGGNIQIIKNGINVSKFKFSEEIRDRKRNELGVSNNFVVGHIGRFHFQKNHDFLIEIFKELYEKDNSAVLLLVGEGEDKDEIKAKVSNMGLNSSVMFLGRRSDISEIMQAMDVFVLPSRFEGLPVVGVEAQSAGLPCIFSDAVTKDISIIPKCEFLGLEDDLKTWADEILKYKNGYKRHDMTQEIENAGYNIKDIAKWIEDFYIIKNN